MKRRTVLKIGLAGLALGATAPGTAHAATRLRISTWLPPTHHLPADTLTTWSRAIAAASDGEVQLAIDPAPIAKPPAQYDLVRDGIADIAYHVMAYTPGPFEIVRGVELPFISPDAEIGSQACYDWYDRNVGFEKEFKDVKVLSLMVHGPGAIHTKQKITNLEELQNVKLRVGGGGVAMSKALGATPVAMPAPKAYEAISKGVADGAMFPYEAVKGFRLVELVKYHLSIPGGLYTTPFAVIMNRAKWEKLPDAHKKVLTDLGGVAGAKMLGQGWDRADKAGLATAQKAGNEVNTLGGAELERWAAKIAFMEEAWIKKAESRGLDGKALMADLRKTIKKFGG